MVQINITLTFDELMELYDVLSNSRNKVLDGVHAALRSTVIGAMSGKVVNLKETHLLKTDDAFEQVDAWLKTQATKLEEIKNASNKGNAA